MTVAENTKLIRQHLYMVKPMDASHNGDTWKLWFSKEERHGWQCRTSPKRRFYQKLWGFIMKCTLSFLGMINRWKHFRQSPQRCDVQLKELVGNKWELSPHPLTIAGKWGCETQNRYICILPMFFEILQSGPFCGQHAPLFFFSNDLQSKTEV